MIYNIEHFISDFSKRTDTNLKIINVISKLKIDDITSFLSEKYDEYIEEKKSEINDCDDDLEFKEEIIKIDKDIEAYEVTQLINSFYGFLIIPFECFRDEKINGIYENLLREINEYEEIEKIIYDAYKKNHLCWTYENQGKCIVSQFLRHLRNSLAHSGNEKVLFCFLEEHSLSSEKWLQKINSIIFYDTDGNHEFCVELSIEELKKIKNSLIKLFSSLEIQEKKTNTQEQYKKDILEKRKLFTEKTVENTILDKLKIDLNK